MRNIRRLAPLAAVLLFAASLAGCASPDRVLFVTNTAIGIGYDASSADGHVGYNRQEAYIAPDYPKDGGLPPVAASMQGNLDWFSPQVTQYYATGDAALIATGKIAAPSMIDRANPPPGVSKCALNIGCAWSAPDDRRLSVVATNTHIGLVVQTKDTTMSAIDFGYQRQEVSMLPLLTQPGMDIYPSAYASITVDSNKTDTGIVTGLPVTDFIATGGAADALAATPAVQKSFTGIASAAATAQSNTVAKSLNLSTDQYNQLTGQGSAAAAATQAKMQQAVTKLLGRPTADNDTLAPSDLAAIKTSLSTLPGIPATAYTLPASIVTAGQFRTWLDQNDPVEQALIQQQGV